MTPRAFQKGFALVILALLFLILPSSLSYQRPRSFVSNKNHHPKNHSQNQSWLISNQEPRTLLQEQEQYYSHLVLLERTRLMNSVRIVACFNLIFNSLRPDEAISWVMRLPRMFWEISIFSVATFVSASLSLDQRRSHHSISSPSSPKSLASTWYLTLSLMTITTALVDIFIWSPLFAFGTSFEKCSGGWKSLYTEPYRCEASYMVGIGRLLTSMQSLFGGLFYLWVAVISLKESFAVVQPHRHGIHRPNYHPYQLDAPWEEEWYMNHSSGRFDRNRSMHR